MKVIKVGAVWCNGCIIMRPRWRQIESENPWLETEYYDFDEHPEIMKKLNITDNLPVAIFLDKQGDEIKRYNGEVEKNVLLETIEALRTQ